MADKLNIAFFGSSLVSSGCNGAAMYYRGIIRGLAGLGHRVTCYEPDITALTEHGDLPKPPWAKVVAYRADSADDAIHAVFAARDADVVIKTGGVGAFDDELERETLELQDAGTIVAYWDLDIPATLARINAPLAYRIPRFDCILTCGGGKPALQTYTDLGARRCVPILNALDPATHYPVASDPRYWCNLVYRGDRRPDREQAVEEFFLLVAECLPDRVFLLAGDGWEGRLLPRNVVRLGCVPAREHNALNCSATAVLSISQNAKACRDAADGTAIAPASALFEAAGAAACIISDEWAGIDEFLEPGSEVLVARTGADVVNLLERMHREDAEMIGAAARRRILSEHTYSQRAILLTGLFARLREEKKAAAGGVIETVRQRDGERVRG